MYFKVIGKKDLFVNNYSFITRTSIISYNPKILLIIENSIIANYTLSTFTTM